MALPETQPSKLSTLRRSQRVCLSVPVMIAKSEPGKPLLTEDTRTLIVSAHGALFVLQMAVHAGELLILKHKKTQEEIVCRVINSTPDQAGKFAVGVEFEHPSPKFWRVPFPPSDWSPRSADAKLPTAQPTSARTAARKLGVVASDPFQSQPARALGQVSSKDS